MNKVIVIGGGPAGLMAAETLAASGVKVHLYERKPSLGRKFLMAGRGGLNLTHSEPLEEFLERYGDRTGNLTPPIRDFTPDRLRAWCEDLGQETFTGSSGRVFPKAMKASPLLRAWIARLNTLGVEFHLQHTWRGWKNEKLLFLDAGGNEIEESTDAALLALGGASWPSLGSDGSWVEYLDIPVRPLLPANCGFALAWSDPMKNKAGQPLKNIALTHQDKTVRGEIMISGKGIEGGAVYALSAPIRDDILKNGSATVFIDLYPNASKEDLLQKFKTPRGRQSLSTYLQKTIGLHSVAATLLHEGKPPLTTADDIAERIKSVPLTLTSPFDIDRAISTAGGIPFEELDENFMLRRKPGVFAAGEMLDWEAPTGGYLLQATFATGRAAALGILHWLRGG